MRDTGTYSAVPNSNYFRDKTSSSELHRRQVRLYEKKGIVVVPPTTATRSTTLLIDEVEYVTHYGSGCPSPRSYAPYEHGPTRTIALVASWTIPKHPRVGTSKVCISGVQTAVFLVIGVLPFHTGQLGRRCDS